MSSIFLPVIPSFVRCLAWIAGDSLTTYLTSLGATPRYTDIDLTTATAHIRFNVSSYVTDFSCTSHSVQRDELQYSAMSGESVGWITLCTAHAHSPNHNK